MTSNLLRLLPSDRTLKRLAPWLLALIGLVVLLPGTFSLPLIDRDEPRFAQATVEMLHKNDWIIPWFNGEYRFDKPPLSYWMMRGGFALFGITEFGARFHSVACAIALALLLYNTGRRWFSEKTGVFAGFFSLTAMQTLIHGRSCVADMPMILAVAVSCIAIYELLASEQSAPYPWKWFWALHGSLAIGFLAKGPIAWAVPFLALILLRFGFYRKPLPWKRLKMLTGLPIILIPLAAWGIPALIQTGGEFWNIGIGEHVVKRGYSVFNSRKFIPGYYIATALISLFPWIALLGIVWRLFRKEKSLLIRWLAAWFIAPYLIFSFYLTQLPHYVMPGFAAFFLLLAEAVSSETAEPGWGRKLKKIVSGTGTTAGSIVLAASFFIPFSPAVSGLKLCLAGLAAVVLGLSGLLTVSKHRTVVPALLVIGLGFFGLGAGLRPCVPGPQLQSWFHSLPEETVFAYRGYTEPNLVFYSDRKWHRCKNAQDFLNQPGPRVLIITECQMKLEDFIKRESPKNLKAELEAMNTQGYSMFRFEGFNPARSAFMTLRIYHRP